MVLSFTHSSIHALCKVTVQLYPLQEGTQIPPPPTTLDSGLSQVTCLTNSGRNAYTPVSSLCLKSPRHFGSLPCFSTFDKNIPELARRRNEQSPINQLS